MSNIRKSIYFTADWHIGHNSVLKYDQRPFRDVEHMHKVLINKFNSCVPENGITYFIGDMGLAKFDILKNVISQLNGTKILILGNHDGGINSMYSLGFDSVLFGATLYIAGQKVTLTHCPLRGLFREDVSNMKNAKEGDNWHGESRHFRFSTINEGQFHLHGHTHSKPENKILGRQFDVGVRANSCLPVSISKIESWISLTLKQEKENGKCFKI